MSLPSGSPSGLRVIETLHPCGAALLAVSEPLDKQRLLILATRRKPDVDVAHEATLATST